MTRVFQLEVEVGDDCPLIDWERHPAVADAFIQFDALLRDSNHESELMDRLLRLTTQGHRSNEVDAIYLTPGLAVSERAKNALRLLNIPRIRFFPFQLDSARFFVVTTDRIVDCLDHERSQIEYFRSNPTRVKHIRHYAFHLSIIPDPDLFTIPELCDGMFSYSRPLFVTGAVVAALSAAGLQGFRFEQLV
ncbi:MAG: hypothetical protein C0467_23040 [Planctomycetaceae bacterium]|nr:hypothetical protein [Planctomycetaceae bacterium]